MNVSVRFWALALVGATVLGGPAAAQQRRGGPPADRAEMERRIQAGFAELVRVQLGLEQETARVLAESVQGFQQERMALVRRESELRVRRGFEPGRRGFGRRAVLIPDAEALEILREMRALRAAENDLYVREQERLLEILTPGQLVRYYLLRDQLSARIRGLRDGGPPRRPSP